MGWGSEKQLSSTELKFGKFSGELGLGKFPRKKGLGKVPGGREGSGNRGGKNKESEGREEGSGGGET